MASFYKEKRRRTVRDGELYEDGVRIGLEEEITPLTLAINNHRLAYTEAACKGHFGAFLPRREIFMVSNVELLTEDEGTPFKEAYPNLDSKGIEFFYDRGDVRLVISKCSSGVGLDSRLKEWVSQRAERTHIKPNRASENDGICVVFSPDVSEWVTGSLPAKIRKYSFDKILSLDSDRVKSIRELQQFFEQEVKALY